MKGYINTISGDYIEVDDETEFYTSYLMRVPVKIGECYIFNMVSGVWVFNKEQALIEIRSQRDALLTETDWTQLPDSPLSPEVIVNFRAYRKTLRELPDVCDPQYVLWPAIPDYK